jgi:hypothetical protein
MIIRHDDHQTWWQLSMMIDMIMHYLCIQCGVSWLFKWLGSTGNLKGSNPSTYARLSLRSNQDSNQSIWHWYLNHSNSQTSKIRHSYPLVTTTRLWQELTREWNQRWNKVAKATWIIHGQSWIPKRYHFLADIRFFWLAVYGSTKFGWIAEDTEKTGAELARCPVHATFVVLRTQQGKK